MRSPSNSFTSSSMASARSRAAAPLSPSWSMGTSMSCWPTVITGLRLAMGSWYTMATRRPRRARSSDAPRLATSRPSTTMPPLTRRPDPPRQRTTARATVDLPQPDSPTSPSASPGAISKLRSGTTLTSPARVQYEIRACSTTRTGVSVTEPDLPETDSEEVEADHQRRDGRAGEERHVRPHRHHAVGILDHAAPVGIGRRQPDAEEAEGADDHHVVARAQAHVDDEGPPRVGEDLRQHDVERRLAAHLGRGHVLALAQLEGEAAHDAGDDRRLGQREHGHDVDGGRAEVGEDDHVEDDHGERQHDVARAHDDHVDDPAVVPGGAPE